MRASRIYGTVRYCRQNGTRRQSGHEPAPRRLTSGNGRSLGLIHAKMVTGSPDRWARDWIGSRNGRSQFNFLIFGEAEEGYGIKVLVIIIHAQLQSWTSETIAYRILQSALQTWHPGDGGLGKLRIHTRFYSDHMRNKPFCGYYQEGVCFC